MTANATHPGRVTVPGTDVGVKGTLVAEPQTENMLLSLSDRLALGPVKVDTDPSGTLEAPGLVVPIVSGVLWLLRFEPHRHDVMPFSLGVFNLNTSGVDLKDLIPTTATAITETDRLNIAAAVALGATNDTATASFLNNTASASRAAAQGLMPVRKLDEWTGTATTADDTTNLAAAIAAQIAGGYRLRATAGKVYRAKNLNLTGSDIDWTGSTLKHADTPGVAALNVASATGAFAAHGLRIDGNKANTADSASDLVANGLYVLNTGGWSGTVRLTGGPIFENCHRFGVRVGTCADLSGSTLSDAASAPASACYMESPIARTNDRSGIACYGLAGLRIDNPSVTSNSDNGLTIALCKASEVYGVTATSNGQHGYVSQYCADDYVDGVAESNGKGGFTWGGGTVGIAVGKRHRGGLLTARNNGLTFAGGFGGVTFDPTLSGSPGVGQATGAKITGIIATGNGLAGVQVTCATDVEVGSITADNNGTHGISVSSKGFSVRDFKTRNNGNATALDGSLTANHHGFAVFGTTTEYGIHKIGHGDISGNGDGSSSVFFASTGTRFPSSFTVTDPNGPSVTVPGAPLYVELASDHAGVTSSTTNVNTALTLSLAASSVYTFEAYIRYDGSATGDIRNGFDFPGSSTVSWSAIGIVTTGAASPGTANFAGELGSGQVAQHAALGAGVFAVVRCNGRIATTSAGSITHKYAQSVSDPTATVVRAGSWMSAVKR